MGQNSPPVNEPLDPKVTSQTTVEMWKVCLTSSIATQSVTYRATANPQSGGFLVID